MTRDEIENVPTEIEMLARMWMQCDPNRLPNDPDEMSSLYVDGKEKKLPRWMWFIPRAKALAAYFTASGYELRPQP